MSRRASREDRLACRPDQENYSVFIWLAIGAVLAGLAATLPLRWAAGITVACLPLAGTAVWYTGADPIVLPLVVTAGFVVRHGLSLFSKPEREQFLALLSDNMLLIGFAAYCVVSGMLFPRLFAGETQVIPQTGRTLMMLGPGQISIVQLLYLLLGVYLVFALRHVILRRGLEFITAAVLIQIGLFAGFGMIQAIFGLVNLPMPTSWIVNNNAYSLLTQVQLGGFTRVTSVFVEASSYAGWATGALGFCYGLYINRVLPTVTLSLLVLVGVTMILSTSSTAYVGLLAVGLLAMVFAFLDSDRARHERGFIIVLGGAVAAIAALVLVFSAEDGLLVGLREMIEEMTINKSQSASAVTREQWAQSAVQNALDTGLLGAGYGALRSSGIFYQLFGAVGVPGLVLFALTIGTLALRTFRKPRSGEDGVVSAGAFAMCCNLGPMAASGSDLALFHMFWVWVAIAGAPVAQRALRRAQEEPSEDAADPTPSEGNA
jgi:hypothetical protein